MTQRGYSIGGVTIIYVHISGTDKALQIPDDLELFVDSDSPDPSVSSSLPCMNYAPPEGEVTFTDSNTTPSTSCHSVAPSTGLCDLAEKKKAQKTDKLTTRTEKVDYLEEGIMADSSNYVRAELAEADSTEGTYEFYS